MRLSSIYIGLLIVCLVTFVQAQSQSVFTYADSVNSKWIKTDTLEGSVHRVTSGTIEGCTINIVYSSPGVRGRVIWGELVPYDKIWVTGAHMATAITITKSIRVGGTVIDPGKYAFFTIPGKSSWTVIINKNPNQHQADDYKQTDDLVRFTVQPTAHATTPRLTYEIITKKKKKGEIQMNWEQLSIAVPFEVK